MIPLPNEVAVMGTPTNIKQVVHQILKVPGPLPSLENGATTIIKEFLANKFTIALARNPESKDVILSIFESLIAEES